MEEADILLWKTKGHAAYITLNRPEVLNSFTPALWEALTSAMERFRDDPQLWVAVLTGAGDRAFSVGADLKWRAANPDAARAINPMGDRPRFISPEFECWKPVVAAVNGYALGGGLELALACDIIIAAENARFGFPEPRRGQVAAGGGVHRAVRHMPIKTALGLLLTGKIIDASEAHRIGLINAVAPNDKLNEITDAWVQEILECSPLAVQAAKQAATQGLALPLRDALSQHYSLYDRLLQSEDFLEGPRAFAEKRKPVWKNE